MYNRATKPLIEEYLEEMPAVIIEGPRQAGKSTLVKQIQGEFSGTSKYFTMDSKNNRDTAKDEPALITNAQADLIIIDEIQKAPDLINELKVAIDENDGNKKWIITGSTDIFQSQRESRESLLGRALVLHLDPLSQSEIEGVNNNFIDTLFDEQELNLNKHFDLKHFDLMDKIVAGGYPKIQNLARTRSNLLRSYIETSLTKDVKEIQKIGNLREFKQLYKVLAAQSSSELNMSNIANDIGMKLSTVSNYIDVLERMFLVFSLEGWHNQRTTRAKSTPKLYLNDTGLMCASNHYTRSTLKNTTQTSPLGLTFETFVVTEIKKLVASSVHDGLELYYYQNKADKKKDEKQAEVDLVIEHGDGRKVLIEIKSNPKDKSMYRGLRYLKQKIEPDEFYRGLVITGLTSDSFEFANTLYKTREGFYKVPVAALWSE